MEFNFIFPSSAEKPIHFVVPCHLPALPLYLFAFAPDASSRHIAKRPNAGQNYLFRVDNILSVGAASNISWVFTFLRIKIRYRLSGPLTNYKPRRSHEYVLHRDTKNKFVDILTEEDYPFWFRQRILRYGANARVIEPDWLASELENEFKQAYLNYCQNPSEQTDC